MYYYSDFFTACVLFLFVLVYFFPAILARCRGHHNMSAIFVTTLLFGWTLLGWALALIWASTAVVRAPAPVYKLGKETRALDSIHFSRVF